MKFCIHENTPENPAIVRETLHTNGVQIVARRQCSMCNATHEQTRPLPKDFEANGIDAFYDWSAGVWQPKNLHAAYQERLAAKVRAPEQPSAGAGEQE